ncbi:uncharacterized protein PAC_18697 [Phialocephala subalpina]|uniref:Protein kinase domain-containing protein n=1 Tax=Phialocephala subalpina TaxID=576137 RepID=A0A1L7XUY1_9HELO|nr:uncharacterized protein PAC_18697 [Phialocephala subalpina]
MDELRDSIKAIRFKNQNHEGRRFIPEATLFSVVTELPIQNALRNLGVPTQEIGPLSARILQGARKCFACLLLTGHGKAISGFFRHDSLQQARPDDRLPYTSEAVEQIFKNYATPLAVKEFLEKQWEFAIPIMHQDLLDRELDKQVILPFLKEEEAGQGSMGKVWKVKLHPQCHRLPLEGHWVIRKQIDCGPNYQKAAFQKELANLSLLTHLKHDNIVELYCSYIYRDTHNLIFAVAKGGSLADLLSGKASTEAPEGFELFLALADLASAIDAVHNFTLETDNLSLSGCHHDLAPRNILIHGKTFVLADFGLSTFRTPEDSFTTFKEVCGSYVAPECQSSRGDVSIPKINRASDIWSFGCILTELLTYMTQGSNGVEEFRQARKTQVDTDLEWYRFHEGYGKPNRKVSIWLDKLQASREPCNMRLVDLIREMLSMNPDQRPHATHVLAVLRGISIVSLANRVNIALEDMRTTRPSIVRMLDMMRFQGWLDAFNQLLDDINRGELEKTRFDYFKMVQALQEMRGILEGNEKSDAGIEYKQQSLLRFQRAKLTEALPLHYRSVAKEKWETQILQKDDAEQLEKLLAEITEAGDHDIGVLVAVRKLTILADTGRLPGQEQLSLDRENVAVGDEVGIHNLAILSPTSKRVIVEWRTVNESWADDDTGRELYHRLKSVVRLLHTESAAQIPGCLRCRGMFQDPDRPGFGVVYDLPASEAQAVTLHSLLSEKDRYCPLLEHRFRLAFDICRCIYTFHKVRRLHRNLHSKNVLFFPLGGARDAERAREPRILGFAGSRENELNSISEERDGIKELKDYHHPEYLSCKARYREEFDYYSVGMLLLEIGLWRTLSEVTKSERFKYMSPEEFRKEVIAKRVPRLDVLVGTHYMEATRTCLEGGFVRNPGDARDERDSGYLSFKRLVMDKIPSID